MASGIPSTAADATAANVTTMLLQAVVRESIFDGLLATRPGIRGHCPPLAHSIRGACRERYRRATDPGSRRPQQYRVGTVP